MAFFCLVPTFSFFFISKISYHIFFLRHHSPFLCRPPRPPHYQIFLPGYNLHQCLELTKTFDGLPNMYGFTQEYLLHKIEALGRSCWKTGELVKMLNDELYSMHIPHHVLLGWNIMQTVHSICTKIAAKYTNYEMPEDPSLSSVDSLACQKEITAILHSLQYCIWNNPKDNIKASLNLMGYLLKRCSTVIESYLAMIERNHRNVQAE